MLAVEFFTHEEHMGYCSDAEPGVVKKGTRHQYLPVPCGITAKDVDWYGEIDAQHPEILKLNTESPFCSGELQGDEVRSGFACGCKCYEFVIRATVQMKDPSLEHLLSNAVAFFLREKQTKGSNK